MRHALVLACVAVLSRSASADDQPADASSADAPSPTPTTKPPTLVQDSAPIYPPKALEDRVHAVVVVAIEISETGQVTSATAGSSTVIPENGAPRSDDGRYGFAQAAMDAARGLVFTPAEHAGKPFAVQIDFTYRFTLPPKPPEEPKPDVVAKPPARSVVNFKGKLVERGTRSDVPGAVVTVFRGEGKDAEGFEATTGPDGAFEFYDMPEGKWSVRVEREGYVTITTDEVFSLKEIVDARYWIEKGSYSPYDVTIEAERPRKEVNRRSLDAADIAKMPGPIANDPVLIVENLPSVARNLGGDIIVRGSGPMDTGVFINGINVPLIYHFGGLKSIVPGNVIGGIEFYPGNFSAQYGRGMGGVLDLQLKRLKPERVHGSADISLLDTSLYLEVPISKNAAIAFAGRRSYIDFVLNAAIPEDADIALTSAPRYYDGQILGNWRPDPAHEVRWLALGSDDLFKLLFEDPAVDPSGAVTSNELSSRTSFVRGIADYRYTPSTTFNNLLRLSVGRDAISFSFLGALGADTNVVTFQARDTATWTLNKNLTLDVGVDALMSRYSGSLKVPNFAREGEEMEFNPEDIRTTVLDSSPAFDIAPFIEARATIGKLTLVPGLRLDYFGLVNDVSLDPRLTARYELPGDVAIKGGVAVVHQSPSFLDLDPGLGNPDLGLQRALQYSVGVEWKPTDVIRIDATAFYKDMQNLVSSTDALVERDGQMVPAISDNNGKGRVYGAELFVEHTFSNNFRGWLSYTLSRAERRDSGSSELRLFDYDQPHILAVVGSYALPRHWQIGARFRVVSGSPDTPVIGGIFSSQRDEYVPVYGAVNSDRLPLFQQFDVRLDKTFVFDTWKFSAYLSLVNATNHRNVESRTYNFDYTQQSSVAGLPILPILGMTGEW